MNRPKFVIGIGSQRAGSTLLHRILDECTDVFMHPVKELHYFDTLFNVRHQDVLTQYSNRQLDREFERLIKSNDHAYISNNSYKCFLRTNRILAIKDVKNIDYIDLFRPCFLGNEVIGEITPEYMALPDEGVEAMASVVGANASIVLITRDPVDRFVSAFKLLKAYGNDELDMTNFEQEIVDVFKLMPDWIEHQKMLNDYQLAKEKYDKYFENVLVISYDELIGEVESTHAKLESCLGMTVDLDKYRNLLKKKVNNIGETSKLSNETLGFIRKNLM